MTLDDKPDWTGSEPPRRTDPKHGIGSVRTGMQLVNVLAEAAGPLPLKTVAANAGMPPAKAHRYLASFIACGMVAQLGRSGHYDLGPMALRIGVAALKRNDVVERACDQLAVLRDTIRATCFVAGWSDQGPLILRWEDSLRPVTVIVEVGSIMPLLTSATGRAFLSFLPAERTSVLVERERQVAGLSAKRAEKQIVAVRAETVASGLGRSMGEFQGGVSALSMPLVDPLGGMVGAVTALGRQGEFDAAFDGVVARSLAEFALDPIG